MGIFARARSRVLPLALAGGLLATAGAVAVAPPAQASGWYVLNVDGLRSALADCSVVPNVVTLAVDISAAGEEIATSCTTQLRLNAFDLDLRNIRIASGTELEIVDRAPPGGDPGTLTVDASSASYVSGIRTTDAALVVSSGRVVASGGVNASAIGGDLAEAAGSLTVRGGTVQATAYPGGGYGTAIGGGYLGGSGGDVTVSGGVLAATNATAYGTTIGGGGAGSAGDGGDGGDVVVTGGTLIATADGFGSTAIGGGDGGFGANDRGGRGGSLTIGADGTVIASSPRTAFGEGGSNGPATPGRFGSIAIDGALRLPSGALQVAETVDPGAEIRVGATGAILGGDADPAVGATITGTGQIQNDGVIALSPDPSLVLGNNRLLDFATGDPEIRVFAPTMSDGYRTLPAPPAGTAWNTAADGSGHGSPRAPTPPGAARPSCTPSPPRRSSPRAIPASSPPPREPPTRTR
ncbi:hypothetical protein MUN77_05235 [Leucobacter allii]|uniref:hypothetical protein n=1 Tax=Leucobacter allii TaxID=2932247 RepID=UPI001FCF7EB5|nr:hypothetical protein [Leucobacter allii]UOR02717.1 hypothetical protein MUN77_05235 [Leucobacter allii]